MDTKSLAKSKRAHTLHHKKHHPNQKAKAATTSTGASSTDKAPGKAVKEKPRVSQGPSALPSNWDRYEDEDDPIDENQVDGYSSQPSAVVVRKSKGADYAYLISEAKSQSSKRLSTEIFPSLDDFIFDFGQGKDSFLAVQGESLLSSVHNDNFFVEDKTSASFEASFLSLNLHALSDQLAKIDLPKRLFMEADLFSPEQLYLERRVEHQETSKDHDNADGNELQKDNHHKLTSSTATKTHHQAVQDHTSSTAMNPVNPTPSSYPKSVAKPSDNQSKFEAERAETELDMLLDSFADTNLKEKASTSAPKRTIIASFDIDSTLDDLLDETSTHEVKSTLLGSLLPPSQPVFKSELLDDFDSWLDTI